MTDNTINPAHYHQGGLEAIDVIEAFFPDSPHLANVFKYTARMGKKEQQPAVRDAVKAFWYLARYIKHTFGGKELEDAVNELSFREYPDTEAPVAELRGEEAPVAELRGEWGQLQDVPSDVVVTDIKGRKYSYSGENRWIRDAPLGTAYHYLPDHSWDLRFGPYVEVLK